MDIEITTHNGPKEESIQIYYRFAVISDWGMKDIKIRLENYRIGKKVPPQKKYHTIDHYQRTDIRTNTIAREAIVIPDEIIREVKETVMNSLVIEKD